MTDSMIELVKDLILSKMAENAKTEADHTALSSMKAFFDTPEIRTEEELQHYKAEFERLISELPPDSASTPSGIQAIGLAARINQYESKGGSMPAHHMGPMQ